MAAVEPAQRAQELQLLLRGLTESTAANLPPEPTASARSYPIGNWYRSAISPSWATALNLTMGVAGPGAPRIPKVMAEELLSRFPTTTPRRIINKTKAEGGYSVNLPTGDVPKTGIMAGKFANADPRTRVLSGDPTMVDITDWVKQNEKVLGKPENYVGTWKNDENGKTYLDVSRRFEPDQLRQATKFGEKTGQISLYDVGKPKGDPMRYPPVGNFPKYVTGEFTPEGTVPYAQKLQEMGRFGRRYMRDQPTREWWRQPDIERVYGSASVPQQRGFLAATSTNSQPPPNVQMMSEYQRRLIKGEPMVQPDWRAPPTAMGGAVNPGSAMGLETGKGGREFNLEAAARGDLAAMRGPVVREKLQALGGDPLAIVLDRIQVRLPESPKAGIYAEPQEGVSPTGENRQLVKDAITKQAKISGEDPDVFGANVWAGIREWVKRTGDLYGVPMERTQAGTRAAASKSYNDIFVDLVAKKAKHLGISIAEMEAKLRSGDAELLSHLLAVPALASLYKLSRGAQSELQSPPGNVAPNR